MKTFFALAAAAAVFALPAAAQADAFGNGSFETGAYDQSTSHNELGQGSTAITGWTVVGGGTVSWDRNDNPYGLSASDGDYALDLTGLTDAAPYGGMRQTFDTLAGHLYSLSFDVGASSAYTSAGGSSVEALINGASLFTATNTDLSARSTWATGTMTFITGAGQTSTILDLIGRTGGNYIGLDNVRVTDLGAADPGAVPEPVTWATMTMGFGAIGASMRRRRQAKATAFA